MRPTAHSARARSPRWLLAIAFASALLAGGCQIFVDTDVAKGIGTPCAGDDECHGGMCSDGVCTVECSASSDCPAPSECIVGHCQVPLHAGIVYVGVPQDEGWTFSHEEGRRYAVDKLPWLRTEFVTNTFLPEDATKAIDDFVGRGDTVIVANSFSLREPMQQKASEYLTKKPELSFLTCASNVEAPNLGSYFARTYQAWYLAGYAAGLMTKTNRLGYVGSFVTPEVVRHIDAYALGAKHSNPKAVVEVRWMGFWFDTSPPVDGQYLEERLTSQLVDSGCDVIGHNADNGRTVATVEKLHKAGKEVYSIGNDNIDACKQGPSSCIGSSYSNWGPMYVRLFDEIHRGTWDPKVILNDNILVDPVNSIVNFGLNDAVADSNLKIAIGEQLARLAREDDGTPTRGGVGVAFRGPYCSTGQRDVDADGKPDCIGANETLSDDELNSMCWFVEGVVQRSKPDDPQSADVPARVPVGDVEIPAGSGSKPDCRVNQ
jgi:basic membrane lipoprotein Med (substrate-binding protein (PBP1-ABC) superfamily)